MRYVRLRDTEQAGNLPLLEALVFEDFMDVKPQLCPCKKLVRILKAQVAKTLPEPSSNSISLILSFIFRKLPCFHVSLLDQINVLLRRCNPFLRFLLKGMKDIDLPPKLHRYNRAVSIGVIPQGNFDNTAANSS